MKTLTTYSPPSRAARSDSTAALLGHVMLLVAAAIGACAVGSFLGRGLSPGTATVVSFVAFGMLIVQAFGGEQFRAGPFAVGWLCAVGLVLGLGLGPVLVYYASADPAALRGAGVTTTGVVAAVGIGGYAIDRSLARWTRPLSFAIFGLVVLSVVLFLAGSPGSPWLSLAIAGVSVLLIVADLNYIRHHGTEDDAVLLATGIFVSVVNIFLSLLNLFSRE